ncbi:meiosis-specific kinetochore protein [Suncus etruscus]|uniref:meiosis-specific kinetochore protein n=1 Tax=Suncus etruscus TaxID=109475 RepID=UPI00210FD886|nr:meiosis-specific kinetochore protein [Suncus etruscus]
MAVWLRAYTRKKPAGSRLNLTPTPGLDSPARVEALPGPGLRRAARAHGLADISEKAEQSCQAGGGGGSGQLRYVSFGASSEAISVLIVWWFGLLVKKTSKQLSLNISAQLRFAGKKSLQEVGTSEEIDDATTGLWSESETDGLQVDSSLSNSDLVSGLSLQHHISNSLLDCSTMDSSKESLSSFSSPEVFRGSDYFDRSCPKLEEYMLCKNSTLLDTSKAVAVEKVPLFSNLSSIIGSSSEDYQKCHRKIVMTLTDQDISPKLKNTSNPESENAACEILLAEKPCTLIPEKMKKKASMNSSTSVKKRKGLLTSTPSSQTVDLVIDFSSIQRSSFEELFPNVSNYVNSNEIVPVSGLQEKSSNEVSSDASELCCIVRASLGNRQVKSKTYIKKKKYSPSKNISQAYGVLLEIFSVTRLESASVQSFSSWKSRFVYNCSLFPLRKEEGWEPRSFPTLQGLPDEVQILSLALPRRELIPARRALSWARSVCVGNGRGGFCSVSGRSLGPSQPREANPQVSWPRAASQSGGAQSPAQNPTPPGAHALSPHPRLRSRPEAAAASCLDVSAPATANSDVTEEQAAGARAQIRTLLLPPPPTPLRHRSRPAPRLPREGLPRQPMAAGPAPGPGPAPAPCPRFARRHVTRPAASQ